MEGKLLFSLQISFSASLTLKCVALPHTPKGALPLHPAKGTRPFGIPITRFARGIQIVKSNLIQNNAIIEQSEELKAYIN